MIASLFIDPAAHTGIALAVQGPGETLPRIVGAWEVYGEEHLWYPRALEVCRAVAARIGYLGLTPAEVIAWIEQPGDHRSWGKRNVRHGEVAVREVARRCGLLEAAWHAATGLQLRRVQQRDWCSVFTPAIPAGKQGDGRHRIREAGNLVPGAREALVGIRPACQVDAAEACLGAAAAILVRGRTREERVGDVARKAVER